MNKIVLLVVFLCLPALSIEAGDRLYGLERMERFDLLPCYLEGTQVRQVSSHDRSGGNDDGFDGTYSALYVDSNGEHVLFDEIGAGCLYRFWMTYLDAAYGLQRLRFYFDNETVPRLDLSIAEFFDGVGAPLEFPLVGPFYTSSHGCYCYLPFPYRERLKVTLSGVPLFYNITYHRFDSSDDVVSWSGSEDRSSVMAQWNAVGADPKPTADNLVVSGNMPVASGATGSLFQVEGMGAIQSIKLDPSPSSTNILSNVWLQMNWDGGEAEVDVPLGDFFGSGRHEFNVSSLPVGMKTTGDWYCYFPMPYWTSANIRLVNKSGDPLIALPFEIQYTTNVFDQAETGYFNAVFHEETFVNDGQDFTFVDTLGRGQLVGLSVFMNGTGTGGYRHTGYLEGDERIHVDGNRSPCVYGTGTEDYFNAGWYFNQGTFSRPSHGCPWYDHFNTNAPNYTQAYRFHLTDAIPFKSSLRFGIEHGPANDEPGTYASVAYYYKAADPSPGLVLVADLDLDDTWTEELYGYLRPPESIAVSNAWNYEGDDDDISLGDTGYSYTGAVAEFTVPLVENNGLLLRRRTDQGVGGQKAQLFVDDAYAGIWYEADHNFSATDKRWLDSEFMVSSNLVAGKTSVRISIVPLPSSSPWNEYRYWVYCVKPFGLIEDSDNDQLPDAWELGWVPFLGTLDGTNDFDADGFQDLDEYIAGTSPTNSASFPVVISDVTIPGIGVSTTLGRLYHLQESSNLVSNDWQTIRADIPGTGTRLNIPHAFNDPFAYYRIMVEKP